MAVACAAGSVDHQWLLQGSPVAERHLLKNPIDHTNMEVHMPIQAGAEPVDERHCADMQSRLVQLRRRRAVGLQADGFNDTNDSRTANLAMKASEV